MKLRLRFAIVAIIITIILLWFTSLGDIFMKNEFYESNEFREFWNKNFKTNFIIQKKKSSYSPPLVTVHLDLKGAPPKLKYLTSLLPLMTAAGANALLIEYEDMFPFEGRLRNISSKNAYKKDELRDFWSACQTSGLEVIPLVQIFGHMEYVLKLDEFKHLREVPESPGELCPSNPQSRQLVFEMLSQVLDAHAFLNTKRIHIGCDEVFNMNNCSRCIQQNLPNRELFAKHVINVAQFLKIHYYHVTPLIWDDMMRSWPAKVIESSNLHHYVEPMIWVYNDNPGGIVQPANWYWYLKYFTNVWVAGAFKGASEASALLPNVSNRYSNQKAWLKFISDRFPPETRLMGYVLTGWSRYDHFATLCELLPVAIPSLVLNSIAVMSALGRRVEIIPHFVEIMRCHRIASDMSVFNMTHMKNCVFPGQDLLDAIQQLVYRRQEVNEVYQSIYETGAWMSKYHVERNYGNGCKITPIFRRLKFQQVRRDFITLCEKLKTTMRSYYNDATIDEWFLQHVQLYVEKLEFLDVNYRKALRTTTWDRRET